MIKFDNHSKITEVEKQQAPNKKKGAQVKQSHGGSAIRPKVVNAKVYKVKSAFVKNAVFITLSYIQTDKGRRPIEIFINSKDLNRAPEYVVLTRLISAIFRRAADPMFILEELHGIHDPNGGSFKEGKYYHSFYAEVAETIEQFFYDVGIIKKQKPDHLINNETDTLSDEKEIISVPVEVNRNEQNQFNLAFKICPTCSSKSLKMENGCDTCVECGYSKCDK
jgi:ribonucleoside-diphosphate reductase alpha chain